MNWINIGTDAYAIEVLRNRNVIDSCSSLLKEGGKEALIGLRFLSLIYCICRLAVVTSSSHVPLHFLRPGDLEKADMWLSVTFESKATNFTVCCHTYTHRYLSIVVVVLIRNDVVMSFP